MSGSDSVTRARLWRYTEELFAGLAFSGCSAGGKLRVVGAGSGGFEEVCPPAIGCSPSGRFSKRSFPIRVMFEEPSDASRPRRLRSMVLTIRVQGSALCELVCGKTQFRTGRRAPGVIV